MENGAALPKKALRKCPKPSLFFQTAVLVKLIFHYNTAGNSQNYRAHRFHPAPCAHHTWKTKFFYHTLGCCIFRLYNRCQHIQSCLFKRISYDSPRSFRYIAFITVFFGNTVTVRRNNRPVFNSINTSPKIIRIDLQTSHVSYTISSRILRTSASLSTRL